MKDPAVRKFGAVAAMVGALLALVFNLLRPMPSDASIGAFVDTAAAGGRWLFVHYMLGWAIGLVFIGLVAIATSPRSEPAASWGRLALAVAIGSTVAIFLAITTSGTALHFAATEGSAAAAEAVAYASGGVFIAAVGSFFGLMPVIYGVMILTGDDYAAWLGWVAIVAGALGIVTTTIMSFAGFGDFDQSVLFPIASVVFTVWVGIMGWMLWKSTPESVAA